MLIFIDYDIKIYKREISNCGRTGYDAAEPNVVITQTTAWCHKNTKNLNVPSLITFHSHRTGQGRRTSRSLSHRKLHRVNGFWLDGRLVGRVKCLSILTWGSVTDYTFPSSSNR